ncbi:hypothetical protein V6O07_22830 [Arthrospira platensis SPKY2]
MNKWAKEQVRENNIFKDLREKNYLLENEKDVLYIFLVHLGLYGWPDDKQTLLILLDLVKQKKIKTLKEICNHWQVEEDCVIGGYESLDRKTGLIDLEYNYDKLPGDVERYILTKLIPSLT